MFNAKRKQGSKVGATVVVALGLLAAIPGHAQSVIFSDDFDDGVLDPQWTVTFRDNPSQANDWVFDESLTLPSWLTVHDILSPAMHTNAWREVILSRQIDPTSDLHVTAHIAWDSIQPPGYPGGQLEASQALMVQLYDEMGGLVAEAGYRDHWGLHSGARWARTSLTEGPNNPGELPLADSGVFEVIRNGDSFDFRWNSMDLLSLAGTANRVSEVVLEFRTFDPSLDRFTPRSYLGTLSIDRFEIATSDTDGDTVTDNTDNCINIGNLSQVDTDGDAIGNACDPDIAIPNDCQVNFMDLLTMKQTFFSTPADSSWNADADFIGTSNGDPDGIVNFVDLQRMKELFFGPPGPSAAGCN